MGTDVSKETQSDPWAGFRHTGQSDLTQNKRSHPAGQVREREQQQGSESEDRTVSSQTRYSVDMAINTRKGTKTLLNSDNLYCQHVDFRTGSMDGDGSLSFQKFISCEASFFPITFFSETGFLSQRFCFCGLN